jgi:flagellin-like protein
MAEHEMKKEHRRRMRYARLRAQKRAVSPVVATLILILVAVAAAAALYLWLVAWQGGITKGIGTPGAQYTVTIGGSTSVYPFAEQAATWFEANQSDVVISVNQGGSGAGAAAVCSGQVDVGMMSSYSYTAEFLETSDGCPQSLNQQIVAYDGVDVIVASNNAHFATAADVGTTNTPNSINWDTLQAIYVDASSTAGSGGNLLNTGSFSINGQTGADVPAPAQGTGFAWDQIPAFATAESGATLAGTTFEPVDRVPWRVPNARRRGHSRNRVGSRCRRDQRQLPNGSEWHDSRVHGPRSGSWRERRNSARCRLHGLRQRRPAYQL